MLRRICALVSIAFALSLFPSPELDGLEHDAAGVIV